MNNEIIGVEIVTKKEDDTEHFQSRLERFLTSFFGRDVQYAIHGLPSGDE